MDFTPHTDDDVAPDAGHPRHGRAGRPLQRICPPDVLLERPLDLPGPSVGTGGDGRTSTPWRRATPPAWSASPAAAIYDHFLPPVVRSLTLRPEFVTSYTPYQSEVSQGVLQALFEYQSMVAAITGLPVANASLYDGATAGLRPSTWPWPPPGAPASGSRGPAPRTPGR